MRAEESPDTSRARFLMLFSGGLRVRMTGWRRFVGPLAGLYFWPWVVVAGSGWIPRSAFVVFLVPAIVAGLTLALIWFGPTRVAAPLAPVADTSHEPEVRHRGLLLIFAGLLAAGIVLAITVNRHLGLFAAVGASGLVTHLWETSPLKRRRDALGPDESLMLTTWDEWRAKRRAR